MRQSTGGSQGLSRALPVAGGYEMVVLAPLR